MDKKILFINNGLSYGGSEKVMTLLANEFSKRNYKITMIVLHPAEEIYKLNNSIKKVNSYFGNYCGLKYILFQCRTIRDEVKKGNYDAIISFMTGNNVITLLAGIRYAKKIIVSERVAPIYNNSIDYVFRIAANLLYPLSKNIILQTEELALKFRKPWNKCSVIPNPVSSDIELADEIDKREKIIISVGRLDKQKNFPMLVTSFSKIHKEYPEYRLVIYGKGDQYERLVDLCNILQIDKYVEFPGFVENVNQKMKRAYMFVLPSDYEGISNAMIEAMAMGLPVICTDCPIGGAKMMIDNGENGLLVHVRDSDELYLAMKKLIDNKELAQKLGSNAKKICSKYSIESITDMWEKIINE